MWGSPCRAAFNCSASWTGFDPLLVGNPRTNLAKLACVTFGEKWMLAMPDEESMRAKPFSAAAASSGVPSKSNWSPETARSTPASLSEPRAVRNSVHAISYCFAVRGWPKSYIRANLSRMFRLRTKARAAAVRTSGLVAMSLKSYLSCVSDLSKIWGYPPFSAMVRVSFVVLPAGPMLLAGRKFWH